MAGTPWRFSPIQNVVNVKLGEGLAVEFGDKDQDPPADSDNLLNKKKP